MGWLRALLLASIGLWSGTLMARLSCLPDFNSLQILQVIDLAQAQTQTITYPLKSMNAHGLFETRAQLEMMVQAENWILDFKVLFDPKFGGVSLPYNVYALLVIQGGQVISWQDFTGGCRGPGIGFFPGQVVQLPKVKLIKSNSNVIQVMLWGRL